MRRRVIAISSATVVASLAALGGGRVSADENTALAEAQFEAFLATHTQLIPPDVTCAALPDATVTGPMLCYALLSDRQIVAAVAELESPGVYRFISVNKVETATSPAGPQSVASPADRAVLDVIRMATAPDSRLGAMILQANPDIASVDHIAFFEATGTIEIGVTTKAANPDVRNAIAFAVTEVLSGLWSQGQALRDPSATVQPRLEVTVDGVLYSSAYGVMTAVADGTMLYNDWLELT